MKGFCLKLLIAIVTIHRKNIYTVACSKIGLFGVILSQITYLESAAMLFFKLSANIYDLGLSNEQLFISVGQGAAKL